MFVTVTKLTLNFSIGGGLILGTEEGVFKLDSKLLFLVYSFLF